MFSTFIKNIGEQLSLLLSTSSARPIEPEAPPATMGVRLYLRDGDIIDQSDTDIKIDTEGNIFTKVKGRWVPEPNIVGVVYGPTPL